MSKAVERPRRRFELSIEIGGDTWGDVVVDLLDLARHIERHGPECKSVMGGPSCGHIVTIVERAEMTPERYREQLDAYLESLKSAKPNPSPEANQ